PFYFLSEIQDVLLHSSSSSGQGNEGWAANTTTSAPESIQDGILNYQGGEYIGKSKGTNRYPGIVELNADEEEEEEEDEDNKKQNTSNSSSSSQTQFIPRITQALQYLPVLISNNPSDLAENVCYTARIVAASSDPIGDEEEDDIEQEEEMNEGKREKKKRKNKINEEQNLDSFDRIKQKALISLIMAGLPHIVPSLSEQFYGQGVSLSTRISILRAMAETAQIMSGQKEKEEAMGEKVADIKQQEQVEVEEGQEKNRINNRRNQYLPHLQMKEVSSRRWGTHKKSQQIITNAFSQYAGLFFFSFISPLESQLLNEKPASINMKYQNEQMNSKEKEKNILNTTSSQLQSHNIQQFTSYEALRLFGDDSFVLSSLLLTLSIFIQSEGGRNEQRSDGYGREGGEILAIKMIRALLDLVWAVRYNASSFLRKIILEVLKFCLLSPSLIQQQHTSTSSSSLLSEEFDEDVEKAVDYATDISSSDPDSECRSAADSLLLSLREELARDPAIAAIQSLVTGDGDNGEHSDLSNLIASQQEFILTDLFSTSSFINSTSSPSPQNSSLNIKVENKIDSGGENKDQKSRINSTPKNKKLIEEL
ncbi:MAG: hypothetical protein EZS28_006754, partial [Streblomastix strix]